MTMKPKKNRKPGKQRSDEIYAYRFDRDPLYTGKLSDWVRPCDPRREWMSNTYKNYAYRCVPMTMANSLGWEILNPCTFEAIWNGEDTTDAITINFIDDERKGNPRSHFGYGILTWDTPVIFKTPQDVGMMVQGPANISKHGISPLQGFVETSWLPNGFTMNWQITEPNKVIRFEKGEPFCRVFPYRINFVENFEIIEVDSRDHPEFRQEVIDWTNDREKGHREAELLGKAGELSSGYWSANYSKGKTLSGKKQTGHKNFFKCKPVIIKKEQ